MKWTDGNWWVHEFEASESEPFQYKYVLVDYDTKQPIRWEQGRNRICDPEFIDYGDKDDDAKVVLTQHWDRYTVTFSIFYPLNEHNEYMRINGGSDKLGDWNKGTGPVSMGIGQKRKWLTGMEICPWELPDQVFKSEEIQDKLIYKYTTWNEQTKIAIWEREPSRMLNILDPNDYVSFKRD